IGVDPSANTAFINQANNSSLRIMTNNATQVTIASGGATTFKNSVNSTTAFQIQNTAGNNYIQADTSGANLYLGNTGIASTIQVGNTTGAVAQTIDIGNNTTGSSTETVNIGSTVGTSPVTIKGGTSGITLGPAGGSTNSGVLVKPGSDTTQAFQVQNASGTSLLNVDSTDNQIQLATSTTLQWGTAIPIAGLAIDSISGNDGTSVGGANTTTSTVKLGSHAGDFTSRSAYLTIPNNEVNLTGNWSVEMWIDPTSTGGVNPRTFAMIDSTHSVNMSTGWNSTAMTPYVRINNTTYYTTQTLTTSTWQHVVYESSGGTITIYINGTAYSTTTESAPVDNATSSAIGGNGYSSESTYGYLDEVVLYDAALSSAQVTGRYNSGSGTESLSGSGWDVSSIGVSQWHMNESEWGTGTPGAPSLYDSSSTLQTNNNFNIQTTINSTTAFQVQNSSGTDLLGVD
ncbi:MAG: LamG-like jellyroll fold domain-containing protein, partial [Candidatus Saccharimonadales bacterium]